MTLSLPETPGELYLFDIVDRVRDAIVQRVGAIPDARGVAVSTEILGLHLPRVVSFMTGSERGEDAARPTADLTVASASFFEVMQLPIVAGRGFTAADAASPAPVIVVSRETARRFLVRRIARSARKS